MMWEGIWALGKVLVVFACMLTGIRLRFGIGPSILAGGFVLALLFGMGPVTWLHAAVDAALTWDCISLALIVVFVLMLSHVLERTGQSIKLMDALAGFLPSRRLRLIFFPVLIGLLPMPGGAAFSAPMVRQTGEPLGLTDEELSMVNYWFRHVWELAWPLYPGIIMAAGLLNLPLSTVILSTCPGAIFFAFLGWWFILRPMGPKLRALDTLPSAPPVRDVRLVLRLGMPLIIAIIGSFGLETAVSTLLPGMSFEVGIMAALAAAIICVFIQNKAGMIFLWQSLMQKELRQTLFIVAAIFAFNAVMDQAGVVREMVKLGGGAALFCAAVFVPALVGMVAGITMAFVGASFPLMLGLLDQLGLQHQALAWATLALISGFSGVMASPLHICFIMCCQYFSVNLPRFWRLATPPCLILLTFGFAWFCVLRAL
jgi:integral membrane protein (TIGR00529 family)